MSCEQSTEGRPEFNSHGGPCTPWFVGKPNPESRPCHEVGFGVDELIPSPPAQGRQGPGVAVQTVTRARLPFAKGFRVGRVGAFEIDTFL